MQNGHHPSIQQAISDKITIKKFDYCIFLISFVLYMHATFVYRLYLTQFIMIKEKRRTDVEHKSFCVKNSVWIDTF